jgi:hypothetical protein
MTSILKGGAKLFSDTEQTVAANTVTTMASRTYGLQLNADGQLVVNVPWVDTNTQIPNTDTTYTHSWADSGANAILRLTAGGDGSGNDDLTIVAGSNITLTPSGDNLTISATDTNTQLSNSEVTGMPLTGISIVDGTISATSTILEALGYLEHRVNLNDAKVSDVNHNTITDLSWDATTRTISSSDGNDAVLSIANSTNAGLLSSALYDNIITNNAKVSDINHNTITDLSATHNATNVEIHSSDGNDATINAASASAAGVVTNGAQTFGGTKTFSAISVGDLTVTGTMLTKDSQQVNIGDAIIMLNAEEAGTPSENAGFEVERGTSSNVSFLWDESVDYFKLTNDGTNYHAVSRKYATDITGDAASTDFVVTHNLGTTDVVVSIKEATTSEVIMADVEITSTSQITVTLNPTQANGKVYRVVVIG